MAELRFDGRVVVVTGAGAGLGRAYALLFASRGAKVVVNDLGGGRHGEGKSSAAADSVVQEIKSKGGVAVADYNSVTEGEKIIETALANFGRVDVVVNNAGILRDKSFARISEADWNLVHNVHLKGAFKTTQAAWPHFQKQNYGRVIMTSSNSGIYGNFGQANYSAAKMGLVGLTNTLAIEGRKKNIHCNVIVPTAGSRLTEDILPPDLFAELKPELIAPVVVWLCHENCQDTGALIESAAGWAAKCELVRGVGSPLRLRLTDAVTPEDVKNNWSRVTDMSKATALGSIEEATGTLMGTLEQMREPSTYSAPVVEESSYTVTSKDCILYALGVGSNVQDGASMKYLYENHEEFSALPTLACIPSLMAIMTSDVTSQNLIPGRSFDLSQVLHGEEYVELCKPMPTSGILTSKLTVADVLDKGKGAVILFDVDTFDESGDKVAYTQVASFVVGAGGFGGKRDSSRAVPTVSHPQRNPDLSVTQKIDPNQAALYRLSGDLNPLHIDPSFALVAGYPRPILHGLCSLGFSVRLVLKAYGDNNPAYCRVFKARFVKPVYPGETLKVNMWREGNRIHFETQVLESKNTVITGAYVDLTRQCSVMVTSNHVAVTRLKSEEVFAGMLERINANLEKVKAVNGVFLWNITKDGKQEGQWTLDLKKGTLYKGEPETGTKADTILTVDDDDMADIALGKLNPQTAFMKGKLKIKGNVMLTQRLKSVISANSKL